MTGLRSCCVSVAGWRGVGWNWNVYSAKLKKKNRMNSIENILHSSTGHFQMKIRVRGLQAAGGWRQLKGWFSSAQLSTSEQQKCGAAQLCFSFFNHQGFHLSIRFLSLAVGNFKHWSYSSENLLGLSMDQSDVVHRASFRYCTEQSHPEFQRKIKKKKEKNK